MIIKSTQKIRTYIKEQSDAIIKFRFANINQPYVSGFLLQVIALITLGQLQY